MTTTHVPSASGTIPDPALLQEPAVAPEVGAPGAVTPEVSAAPARRLKRKRILLAMVAILVLLLAILFGWYLMNRKPLSQIPGLANDNMPHYVTSIYGVSRPMGVAVSPAGNRIYVTESDGTRLVKVYDRGGKLISTLNPPKSKVATGHVPVYVAVDPINAEVYVSDRPAKALYVYGQDGAYLRTFKPRGDLGGGYSPLGVAFDKVGNLYVTDVSGKTHRVLVFDRTGSLTRTLGLKGKLSFPNGITVDSAGTVFVSDSNNGRLVTYGPTGKQAVTINRGGGDGDLGLPRGAAMDTSNRLYVVDTSSHVIKVYRFTAPTSSSATASLAKYLGSFGAEGQLDGTFEYPNGVATDSRGRIYVTDRENNRVQVWSN